MQRRIQTRHVRSTPCSISCIKLIESRPVYKTTPCTHPTLYPCPKPTYTTLAGAISTARRRIRRTPILITIARISLGILVGIRIRPVLIRVVVVALVAGAGEALAAEFGEGNVLFFFFTFVRY